MNTYFKTRELEEMGNRRKDKKNKNAQKNVHGSFYLNVA
jgi:hypothetical protein